MERDIIKALELLNDLCVRLTLTCWCFPLLSYMLRRINFSIGKRSFLGLVGRVSLLERNYVFEDIKKRAALDQADPFSPPVIKTIGGVWHLLEWGEGKVLQLIEIFGLDFLGQGFVIYYISVNEFIVQRIKRGQGNHLS